MNKASYAARAMATGKTLKGKAQRTEADQKVRAKTLRLEPAFEVGLRILKDVLGKPVNKMVNEAVGEYIQRRGAEVETSLTGTLERLKACRQADPNFEYDRRQFIAAEARYSAHDPMEGVVYDVQPPTRAATEKARAKRRVKRGPALTMVRESLRS